MTREIFSAEDEARAELSRELDSLYDIQGKPENLADELKARILRANNCLCHALSSVLAANGYDQVCHAVIRVRVLAELAIHIDERQRMLVRLLERTPKPIRIEVGETVEVDRSRDPVADLVEGMARQWNNEPIFMNHWQWEELQRRIAADNERACLDWLEEP